MSAGLCHNSDVGPVDTSEDDGIPWSTSTNDFKMVDGPPTCTMSENNSDVPSSADDGNNQDIEETKSCHEDSSGRNIEVSLPQLFVFKSCCTVNYAIFCYDCQIQVS